MNDFVLDASITLRWFFDAGTHPYADAILQRLSSSADTAFVPGIWRYETSAVLARAQISGAVALQQVERFFHTLDSLPIRLDLDGASRIFDEVHRIATTHRLTTYDAAYFELAQRRRLPLASLDAELIAACRKATRSSERQLPCVGVRAAAHAHIACVIRKVPVGL